MQTPIKISEEDKSSENDINELKKWLSTQPHLPSVPENMLHVFHHSCYFDLNKTKDCIDTYYTIRSCTPEVFKNRNFKDENLKMTSENTINFILPKRSPEGYRIFFQRINSTDSSKYIFESSCKFFFMGLDAIIHDEGIFPGYMILLDYKNVRLGHLTKTSIGSMRKMFRYLQEGSPMRLKAIHMINMNFFVDKVMAFVKPFMDKDLYNLIHFYPEGQLQKLYEHIPLECLPADYGGTLASCEIMYETFLKKLESYDDYYKSEENAFPVNEKLRPSNKKSKKKKDLDNEITLKTLELD